MYNTTTQYYCTFVNPCSLMIKMNRRRPVDVPASSSSESVQNSTPHKRIIGVFLVFSFVLTCLYLYHNIAIHVDTTQMQHALRKNISSEKLKDQWSKNEEEIAKLKNQWSKNEEEIAAKEVNDKSDEEAKKAAEEAAADG